MVVDYCISWSFIDQGRAKTLEKGNLLFFKRFKACFNVGDGLIFLYVWYMFAKCLYVNRNNDMILINDFLRSNCIQWAYHRIHVSCGLFIVWVVIIVIIRSGITFRLIIELGVTFRHIMGLSVMFWHIIRSSVTCRYIIGSWEDNCWNCCGNNDDYKIDMLNMKCNLLFF